MKKLLKKEVCGSHKQNTDPLKSANLVINKVVVLCSRASQLIKKKIEKKSKKCKCRIE